MGTKVICLLAILLLTSSLMLADQNGKIAGIVKDKDTGEGLPSVNISLIETKTGAMSNINGEYFILDVPPGKYALKASCLGYASMIVKNVIVNIDRTTIVNFEMSEQPLELGMEIIVVAEREKIRKDVSFSQNIVTSSEITSSPTGVDLREMIATGVGIDRDQYGHLTIRGGMVDEVGYFVDGMSGNDKRLGIPIIKVPQAAVKEIQVLTGGFSAEYGDARSGMINVVTKDGGPKYNLSGNYRISPAAHKHFGPDLFSPENWWDVGRFLSVGPSEDRDKNGVPDFEGWTSYMARNKGKKTIIGPNGPIGVATSAEDMLAIWQFQHRPQPYADKPDQYVEGTFGGPVPFANDNVTFFYSGFYDRTSFAFKFSRPDFIDQSHTLKLDYRITPELKLRYTGNYGETKSVAYDAEPATFVDAHSWNNVIDAMDGTAAGHLYNADTRMVHADVYRTLQGLDMKYFINKNSFIDVSMQYDRTKFRAHPTDWRDTTTIMIIGGVPLDESPINFAPNKYKDVLDIHRLGEDKGWRDYTWYETFQAKGDYTNQITTNHLLKAGFKTALNKMYLNYGRHRWDDGHINLPAEDWTLRNVSFLELSGYVQDKIELGGMIMNIGLRLDAFKSEVEAFTDPWSAYYQKGKNFDSLYYAPGQLPEMKYVFSPRLGVSHPITEDAKLFFNYGYFFQRGNVENLYTDIRIISSGLDKMGNPNLEFRKTISYELGIEHNVFDIFTYKLSGYYKDVSNEISTVKFSASTYSYSYSRSMNNGYRDIMGFELETILPYGKYLSGRISYDYRLSKGGWYGYQTYYQDPLKKNVLQSPNIDKPKPRPILRANLKYEVPEIEAGAILKSMFSDVIVSTYIRWEAGEYLTYHSEAYPGIEENNIQWTPWYNVDLNVSKKISIAGYDMIVYLEVQNLLNSKFLNGSDKFWNQSLVSQEEYLELVAKKGLKAGTYDDPDVQTFLDKAMYYLLYGPTRDIWFGVKVMF